MSRTLLLFIGFFLVNGIDSLSNEQTNSHPLFSHLKTLKLTKPTSVKATANEDDCDDTLFNFCTTDWGDSIGMTRAPTDAVALLEYVLKYVTTNGKPGFQKFCELTDQHLVACLGESFDACVSTDNFVKEGADRTNAEIYASLFQSLKFECGPAFDVLYDGFDCALADYKEKLPDIKECYKVFDNANDTCRALQEFTDCYMKIFLDCGADYQVAFCDTLKVSYSVTLPECKVSCDEGRKKLPRIKRNNRMKF